MILVYLEHLPILLLSNAIWELNYKKKKISSMWYGVGSRDNSITVPLCNIFPVLTITGHIFHFMTNEC